jgi:hypothetical protein
LDDLRQDLMKLDEQLAEMDKKVHTLANMSRWQTVAKHPRDWPDCRNCDSLYSSRWGYPLKAGQFQGFSL